MSRLAAALLVRIGLVLLVMGVLVRLLPMPNRADAMADDFAIAVSLVLVLAASSYLRLTRDATRDGERPKVRSSLTERHGIRR
jgi:uncharacterized protein YjeT (DUF2065 family)